MQTLSLTKLHHHQAKFYGLIFTITVQATDEFKGKDLKYTDELNKQFLDIAENLAYVETANIDREETYRTAAAQIEESAAPGSAQRHPTRI